MKEEEENIKFLQKLDVLAHRLNPVFSTEARHVVMQFYAKVFSSADSKYSPRLLDTLNNACYAVARLKLKNIVDVDDANEVVAFFTEQIDQHQSKINVVSPDPRDLAVQEMIKVLTGSNFKHEYTELLDTVCKKDTDNGKWVLGYVGKIDIIKNDKKLRKIRLRLKEYASAHKDKILTLHMSPLTLAWRETYTGGDREAAVDIDRVVDPEDAEDQFTPPDTTKSEGTQGTQGTYDSDSGDSGDSHGDSSDSSKLQSDLNAQSALPSSTDVVEDSDDSQDYSEASSDSNESIRANYQSSSTGDIHQRIHELNQEGKSQRQIAKILNTSQPTVNRVLKKTTITPDVEINSDIEIDPSNEDRSKIVDNNPLEDYNAYVANQQKKFDAIEKEGQEQEQDQKSIARQIFDGLALKNAQVNRMEEVLESEFRDALKIGARFNDGDIDVIIKDMEKDGFVGRVTTEIDGVFCDILRKNGD